MQDMAQPVQEIVEAPPSADARQAWKQSLFPGDSAWSDRIPDLARFYGRFGVGLVGQHTELRWSDGLVAPLDTSACAFHEVRDMFQVMNTCAQPGCAGHSKLGAERRVATSFKKLSRKQMTNPRVMMGTLSLLSTSRPTLLRA